MSNFTDFFPAASGGSGLFYSSPKQMPCRWGQTNAISMKGNTASTILYDTQSGFNSAMQRIGCTYHQFTTAQNNTYQEISNITNANGGVFHGAMGPCSPYLSGGTITNIQEFRITIDGTVYDIVANTDPGSVSVYIRPSIGGFPEGAVSTNSSNLTTAFSPLNNYYAWIEDAGNEAFTNPPFTWYGQEYKMYVPINLHSLGGVEFEETLKVELKANNIAGNGSYDYGFSLHSLY